MFSTQVYPTEASTVTLKANASIAKCNTHTCMIHMKASLEVAVPSLTDYVTLVIWLT